jgi:hypothetical protein
LGLSLVATRGMCSGWCSGTGVKCKQLQEDAAMIV